MTPTLLYEDINEINPFWFYRLDEYRHRGGTSNAAANDTVTLYTLYYFQHQPDGSVVRQDLAKYAGQSRLDSAMTAQGMPISKKVKKKKRA